MSVGPVTSSATGSALSGNAAHKEAAQRFEAIFLREMIASMRKGRLAEDVFGSNATDNFREMADAQLAEDMAAQGSFGIAEILEEQLRAAGDMK